MSGPGTFPTLTALNITAVIRGNVLLAEPFMLGSDFLNQLRLR
jgi:hypothetical protein